MTATAYLATFADGDGQSDNDYDGNNFWKIICPHCETKNVIITEGPDPIYCPICGKETGVETKDHLSLLKRADEMLNDMEKERDWILANLVDDSKMPNEKLTSFGLRSDIAAVLGGDETE